jgi:hypothetical protein
LDCKHAIQELDRPPPGFSRIGEVVALQTGAHSTLQTPQPDAEYGQLFAKTGLLVRKNAVFDLVVPDSASTRIRWGNRSTPVKVIRVLGCPAKRDWIAFPGGYWVSEPACVELIVRADAHETVVPIGVGAACPK